MSPLGWEPDCLSGQNEGSTPSRTAQAVTGQREKNPALENVKLKWDDGQGSQDCL